MLLYLVLVNMSCDGSVMCGNLQLLAAILAWRNRRAAARTFALSSLATALSSVSSPAVKRAVIMWIRPALRGVTERAVRTAVPSQASATKERPWVLRHHYAVHLEGCTTSATDKLQAAFISLYTVLSDTLSSSAALNDPVLTAYIMWTWGCDADARDHEFMLRSGMLPNLAAKFSFESILEDRHVAEHADAGRLHEHRRAATTWQPWKLDDIRAGLVSGWLSKHQVIAHALAAPARAVLKDVPQVDASGAAAGAPDSCNVLWDV